MIYCQRCKKANHLECEFCALCGARLMLVSHSYDGGLLDGEPSLEEHLLERISALEGTLARFYDRFEQLLELAQQQAQGSFYDHLMIESLTELLTEMHAVNPDELQRRWHNRVQQHYEETVERERLDERCDRIIASFRGARREQREQFVELVEEGTLLISEGRTRRGLRTLEQALTLDAANADLNFTVGEYYFHLHKADEARLYLRRALTGQSEHFGTRLLLGLLESDGGAAEAAKEHMRRALGLDADSFAAHYVLGRLLIGEGNLDEALTHLKRALTLMPTPEMHYLVGRAYWEQGRAEKALRHLQKAVRLDPQFDAARYSLGWVYWQANRTHEAREHFQAAYDANPNDAHYRTAIHANAGDELPGPPSLGPAGLLQRRKTKINDARFAELLWRDLNTFSLPPAAARKHPRK